MQWRASDHTCGRASDDIDLCDCEPTKVEEQVVSAMVMTSRYSDIELTINIFNVDDATWRRVTTLQPGDDVEDWMDAAREALAEEKAPGARWRADSAHHHPTVQ